jgi:hypothetical protein
MFSTVTTTDWLMITAMIIGPIIAVQLTRRLDERKEVRERKLQIFKTLMATRGYAISWDHVGALNRIDLEFRVDNEEEKAVIEAWKAYLDHLGSKEISGETWALRGRDLFVELLHKMAKVLNYDFDKTHIKNSSYSPVAHGNLEQELQMIRTLLIEMLQGNRPLQVTMYDPPKWSSVPTATVYDLSKSSPPTPPTLPQSQSAADLLGK